MGSLEAVQRNWEIYARSDPMWAALMDPEKLGGGWDAKAFLAAGEKEIATVMEHLEGLGVTAEPGSALDFGCGVGRLTQALARRFDSALGVDISPTMVDLARDMNELSNCSFLVNDSPVLDPVADASHAFVYTSVVLQHMEPRFAAGYLREFARVLAPGGVVVFQIPDRVEPGSDFRERTAQLSFRLRRALGLRTRGRRLLRRVGLLRKSPGAGEAAAEMHCTPESRVSEIMKESGLELIDVQLTNSTDLEFVGGLKYLSTPPGVGFVSKQYCATKPNLK